MTEKSEVTKDASSTVELLKNISARVASSQSDYLRTKNGTSKSSTTSLPTYSSNSSSSYLSSLANRMALGKHFTRAVEKSAVVIDPGSFYTKIGFAGDVAPRFVLKSCCFSSSSNNLSLRLLRNQLIDFFHSIYYQHLLINSKERRVVLLRNIGSVNDDLYDTMVDVLYTSFSVPSIMVICGQLSPLFSFANLKYSTSKGEEAIEPPLEKALEELQLSEINKTATAITTDHFVNDYLVLDIGHSEVRILPVSCAVPVGSCLILSEQISGEKLKEDLNNRKEELVGDTKITSKEIMRQFFFDGDKVKNDNEAHKLQDLILDSISKAPVDLRRSLLSNIVLSGGGTCFLKGFSSLLLEKLKDSLKNNPKYQKLSALENSVNLASRIESCFPPSVFAWTGASIFASLEISIENSTTYDTYKTERLKDASKENIKEKESTTTIAIAAATATAEDGNEDDDDYKRKRKNYMNLCDPVPLYYL